MSSEGIQFDEDTLSTASRQREANMKSGANSQGGMVRWLMDKGIAKSPAMAQGILVAAIAVFFILTYLIIR